MHDKIVGGQGGIVQIKADWLDAQETQRVLHMLVDAGHAAFAVGGCVRNTLLGVDVSDIDITTSAHPGEVTRLAQEAGLQAIATGIEHGTVTVVCNHAPFEITTFRKDVATHGRRATVVFSDSIEDDARRRDFTVNALYVALDGNVLDPLGGLPDIETRRIRFIEDANRRIEEDYLRILRFFRFYAWYGNAKYGIDAEGLAACAAHTADIARLSRERVGAEMKKLLAAPDPAPALAAMAASGVLMQVLAGADTQFIAPLVHGEQTAGIAPRWQRRLVALGGESPVPQWRLSKVEASSVRAIHNALASTESAKVRAYLFGADAALDAALVESVSLSMPLPTHVRADIAEGAAANFPIRGADLAGKAGAGPHIGIELRRLEKLWIESGFTLGRAALLDASKLPDDN